MTAIICNSNATIVAATLEDFILKLFRFGLSQQKSVIRNPNGLDNLSLTTDDEETVTGMPATANGGVASLDITAIACSTVILDPFASPAVVSFSDYLMGVTYTAGTGGTPTFPSTSWVQSLCDAIRLACKLQNLAAKNPAGLEMVTSWAINKGVTGAIADATFTASLKVPLIATETPNGQATKAAECFGSLT